MGNVCVVLKSNNIYRDWKIYLYIFLLSIYLIQQLIYRFETKRESCTCSKTGAILFFVEVTNVLVLNLLNFTDLK